MTTNPARPTSTARAPGMSYQDVLDRDRTEPPETYRWQSPLIDGPSDVPVDRYLSRFAHEQEKQYLWSRVWQVACREEHLRQVGDTVVYDIADKSYLLVRTREGEGGISPIPTPACIAAGPCATRRVESRSCSALSMDSAGRSTASSSASPAPGTSRRSPPARSRCPKSASGSGADSSSSTRTPTLSRYLIISASCLSSLTGGPWIAGTPRLT